MLSATSIVLMSELKSSLARALGERLDTSVVEIAAAVEDAASRRRPASPPRRAPSRPQPPARSWSPENALQRSQLGGGERAAGLVVDQLREDAAVGAEHRETWALGGAGAPCRGRGGGGEGGPRVSSELLMPASRPSCAPARRGSGCPCPCTARAAAPCGSRRPSGRRPACRALDDDLRRRRHLELDPLARRDRDRMRVADGELEVAALELGAVADTLDLEVLLEAVRHALDHVRDERAREPVQRAILAAVGGPRRP